MMVIDWSQKGGQTATSDTSKVPAATYVRMSTEHQKYSTDNQMAVIRRYAEKHGFEIVRSYADEGKSGLRLIGRDALQICSRTSKAAVRTTGSFSFTT